mgnify:CR=1 FL=1
MKSAQKLLLAGVVAILITGCPSQPVQEEETTEQPAVVEEGQAPEQPTEQQPGAETMPTEEATGFQGSPLDDPESLLSKRTIYFDFDKSNIKDKFRDIIKAHAQYLAENPQARVTLEGHADERGTREYNMALGERRAKAVEQMLVLQGADRSQLKTVSYGEERPAALGHDEEAWALNRRVVIKYTQR